MLPSLAPRRAARARNAPGPAQLQRSTPRSPPQGNRENLSPPAGRADEVISQSSSCRNLRPSEVWFGQIGRRLPPSLSISLSYTCGIGVPARLLTVNIWHTLRQAILW